MNTQLVKRLAAVILAIAFVLPLSKCTQSTTSQPLADESSADSINSSQNEPTVRYTYAFAEIRRDSPFTWMIPIAFFWPIVFVVKPLRIKSWKTKTGLGILQIILVAGSGYIIFALTIFEEPLIGTYLAAFALTAYTLATIGPGVVSVYWFFKKGNA